MKLRTVALLGVASLAVLGLIGAGAHGAFTTATTSGQRITVGTFGGPPTVTITYPVNTTTYGFDWTGAITGTASATGGATTTAVKVSIQQVGGDCWTGSGNNYGASCPNYVSVTTGTTSWSLTLPSTDLTSGDSYKVKAEATDSNGNLANSSTVTFTYETALPTVTITYPVNDTTICACSWKGDIKGTASSNSGTSIVGVLVAIEDTTTNTWWNGISFAGSTKTFVQANGTTSWTLPLGGSSLKSGDAYSVIAQATDTLGNVATSSTVSFTYCLRSPPTVSITYPVNKTSYGSDWAGEITGSASATSGATIKSVSVAIEDTTTNKWWNTSSFGATGETFNKATGATTWLLVLPTSDLTSAVSYSIIAEATDNLGSTGTSSTVDFTYLVKTAPPCVRITYPVNKTTYGSNWAGEITGTSSAGTGASISKTTVAIEDLKTTMWWNGSSFGASSRDFVPASGTTTWFLNLPGTDLTSGVTYSVVAEATDNLANTGTSSTVSFTYCEKTASPSLTITYPVNDATYGTRWAGEITGTAAAGTGASVSTTAVAIEDTSTKLWWNGSAFSASTKGFVTATGTTTWLMALPTSDLTSDVSYSIIAQATDNLANTGTSSTVSFTYSTGSHG